MYRRDIEAQKSFQDIRNTLVERAVLYAPDWEAAAYPWRSAEHFEIYIEPLQGCQSTGCTSVWCSADGTVPRPVCMSILQ